MKAAIVLLSILTAQAFVPHRPRVRGRTSIVALESTSKGSSSNKKKKSKSKTSTKSSKTTAKATVEPPTSVTTPPSKPTTTASSKWRGTTDDAPQYFAPRHVDERLLGNLTGGRPGAIIETEEQLAIKARIEQEIVNGQRRYEGLQNYGTLEQDEKAQFDTNDPDAIDADTLGTWTIQDLRSRFDYEWDPFSGEMDPNIAAMNQENVQYLEETEKNEDGVEIGYDPIFGPSNPVDTRAILGSRDSFMIDARTKDDSMVPQQNPKAIPKFNTMKMSCNSASPWKSWKPTSIPFFPAWRYPVTWRVGTVTRNKCTLNPKNTPTIDSRSRNTKPILMPSIRTGPASRPSNWPVRKMPNGCRKKYPWRGINSSGLRTKSIKHWWEPCGKESVIRK
ncbi:hypothetical protein FisN_9Hh247 [Fistulifera solaris]|uniref:Uncharacterized protein n=1 Tax=Fistulifera solaris TaxID=1519565 RepID=A0A1Z5JAY5_FISSO|nr:hypothetical protein FisN_9Hh247 [Fistulifera solaris]|eukprot:GAX11154.1 hypothetical protein FisN_9Hh247 [Fistulifera solaris]